MTQKKHPEHDREPRGEKSAQPRITGAWPDQKARAEMSDAEVTRDNLGKHSKNPDWERGW
jgi:hypothetical protein